MRRWHNDPDDDEKPRFDASASEEGDRSRRSEARRLIERYGENATAWQILNPGIERWQTADGDGLVGFVRYGGIAVAAGEPVAPTDRQIAVADAFTRLDANRRVCWFCASRPFVDALPSSDHRWTTTLIGAQPVWNPTEWHERLVHRPSVRAQIRRARNKGVRVSEWSTDRAATDPGVAATLDSWLAARPFPPLHFLVEPATLGRLDGRRIFVAEQQTAVVAFVLLSPIPQRNGWLVEQFVRRSGPDRSAPNGTIEMALDCAVSTIAEEGYDYLTLGLAPLSQHCGRPGEGDRRLRFIFGWLRLHGRRFYNFDGLDYFKTKFAPSDWEPIWAAANEPRISLGTLRAVGAAFSRGSPLLRLAQGIGRAARAEVRGAIVQR